MTDVQFRNADGVFLCRAAAVAVHSGSILVQRAAGDDFWALPGGRLNLGEDSFAAIEREMFEETGTAVSARRLLWVVENFWTAKEHGLPDGDLVRHHEIGFYVRVDVSEELKRHDEFVGEEAGRVLQFRWLPIDEAVSSDLRPSAIRSHLRGLTGPVKHLINRE